MISRSALTDQLLAELQGSGFPVGLADTPAEAGWLGQPSKELSQFRPYGVLTPAPASISEGPLPTPQADWRLPYVITSYGVDPRQAEMLADRLRAASHALRKQDVGGFRVQQVWVAALGAVVRYEGIEPRIWAQTDTVVVWATPE